MGGAPAGDLYLMVDLLPHPTFRLEGHDLYTTVPVTPWEAALGAKVTVPTLDGAVNFHIPPGSSSGRKIRLKGKGEVGEAGGPAGDLFVVTRVEPSRLFERRGANLVIEVPVTYSEAALGATVEVPTPYGDRVSLKVPPGTQDGRQLRIRGHGAPKLDGSGKGDLIARLRVTVPKKLTKKEREALEELKKVSREDPREALFQ